MAGESSFLHMRLPIQSLEACLDPALAGGKARGLARLLHAKFNVPLGLCVTTAAYRDACRVVGLDPDGDWKTARDLTADRRGAVLSTMRARLVAFSWPRQWCVSLQEEIGKMGGVSRHWAIRSSATNEDDADASGAGLYQTELGVGLAAIPPAITRCWASLWEERVFAYLNVRGSMPEAPAMAVVIQPMIDARVSGVAFSRHPLTGRSDEILINAVPGLGEPLVSGRIAPDEYVVRLGGDGRSREVSVCRVAEKPFMMKLTPNGTVLDRVGEPERSRRSLTDSEAVGLGFTVQEVEQAVGRPIDLEWAMDQDDLWILQARPASTRDGADRLATQQCDWSRANFKETLPEIPSPLGLSFLEQFMEDFILHHYRELGCIIPSGLRFVQVVQGRPFINVTLLQLCAAQLGGHPELVTEQMGGEARTPAHRPARLSAWKLARALFVMDRKIRLALRRAPAWFEELKRTACPQDDQAMPDPSPQEVLRRIEQLGGRLHEGECTFAIVAAVGQAQRVLGTVLPRWLGAEWRSLLNGALQGQHTIVSAMQIRRLREIAQRARHEENAMAFFQADPWEPGLYRERLAGTGCLDDLDTFLTEYGHRAIGESDVMTPRFAEDPTYILEVVRRHILYPPPDTAEQAITRQARDREASLERIRRRFGWRYDRWLVFRWWYARLCRAHELREANRHHLMYYATAVRRLVLLLGRQLAAAGRLPDCDDVFFVTTEEFRRLTDEPPALDWKALVAGRRAVRESHAETAVPDFLPAVRSRPVMETQSEDAAGSLRGISISAGVVEGRVAVVRGTEDIGKVRRGDIIVTPVIDPGASTLFGLAGGLIAEMGGTLSHGAIIVREYGIPAIVNVTLASRLLKDGEYVRVNATDGLVERISA